MADPGGEPAARDGRTARRTLVVAGTTAALVVLLLFVWYARDVLLLAFAGVLLAIFLRRLAVWLGAWTPLTPGWALGVVVVGLLAALAGTFWLRGPAIAVEVRALRETLPEAVEQLRERIARYDWTERVMEGAPSPAALLPGESDAFSRVTGVVSRTLRSLASAAVVLFLAIVLAATPRVYVTGVLALLPAHRVERGREVLDALADTLWWWLVGRVISMTVIGVATAVGLTLFGLPLAFVLALLAALLTFIPNLGPFLSAIPAVLLAFVQGGPRLAIWVAAFYAVVQAIESYVLAPIIDRKTIYLPPALTVLAQLTLAVFAGVLGVALATPLVATLVVIVTMLYVQDVLGRQDVQVRSH